MHRDIRLALNMCVRVILMTSLVLFLFDDIAQVMYDRPVLVECFNWLISVPKVND